MKDSFVVTQAGLVTAGGSDPEALFAALGSGTPLHESAAGVDFPVAAIRDFDPRSHVPKKGIKDLSRTSQLACAAAARLAPHLEGLEPHEVGVVFGSAWGSLATIVDFEREAAVEGPRFVDPIRFTETVANVPAGQVSIYFGWSAFNATVCAGAASGLAALERALHFLEEGRGRVAVAGGGDELNLPMLRSFHAEGRTDLIGGEGACLLAVESADHAQARGARARLRLEAVVSGFDPDGSPSDATLADVLRQALESARLEPAEIDLVLLPSSEERAPDAMRAVFGAGDALPPVVAPKRVLGETWGSYGPLAVVIGMLAIEKGTARNVLVLDASTTGHVFAAVASPPRERT